MPDFERPENKSEGEVYEVKTTILSNEQWDEKEELGLTATEYCVMDLLRNTPDIDDSTSLESVRERVTQFVQEDYEEFSMPEDFIGQVVTDMLEKALRQERARRS